MASEEIFLSVCGQPISANTAISKDIGIYHHCLNPWAIKTTFKKSSAPRHCLAINKTHIFAGQHQKSQVHVYSRLRGNQEALVSFPDRICSLALAQNVLIIGTSEGRLILWEICTGRQVSTPPCHVQAITCLAVSSHHLLSASEDSNINVWSLARLLEFGADAGQEPERILSNHRGAITDLVIGPSTNTETSLCASSSSDKTCILWNYRSGQVLRTLLFRSAPICISLDAAVRALFVCADDGGLYLIELFGDKPLLGSRSSELASIAVQVKTPLGVAEADHGPASCMLVSYDGTSVITGHTKGKILHWHLLDSSHPTELGDLNATVTNLASVPPLSPGDPCKIVSVVKPNQNQRQYAITAQLEGQVKPYAGAQPPGRFDGLLSYAGLSAVALEELTTSFYSTQLDSRDHLRKENDEMRAIIEEQRALLKATTELHGTGLKT